MITGIVEKHARVSVPTNTPAGQTWRYGVGFPFQVAPGLGGVLAAIEEIGTNNYGHLNGSDLLLFRDLTNLADAQTVVLSRNESRRDPATGNPEFLLRSPMYGGFLPLGSAQPDGAEYPHGGTGFGICQMLVFPDNDGETFVWWDSRRRDYLETSQLSYDGKNFVKGPSASWSQSGDPPLRIGSSGWKIISHGLTMAIPDQGDLLLPVLAGTLDNASAGVGVARWHHAQGRWEPISFLAVATAQAPHAGMNVAEMCPWFEPSLARWADGSLLFSARSRPESSRSLDGGYPVCVWRSVDEGNTWTLVIDVPSLRSDSPVSINCAADGSAYLASNPFDPTQSGRGRETLAVWPVNVERSTLGSPIVVRDTRNDFGPPPASCDPNAPEIWMVDHPNAATLVLADGQAHGVLAYRAMHSPPFRPSQTKPSPASGCHLAELVTDASSNE